MKLLPVIFLFPLCLSAQTDSISALIHQHLDHQSNKPVHSVLLYVEKPTVAFRLDKAFGLRKKDGQKALPDDQFRIASITKTFLATIIMQMAEEKKVSLNDKAQTYLGDTEFLDFHTLHIFNNQSYSEKIRIKHLLSHRSGLADIFTDKGDEFFALFLQNPTQQYSPQEIIKTYFQLNVNQNAHFKPNEGWHYSDMNYVLLGLIIQSLDKKPLAQSIRDRILEPLNMDNSFFEFYEKEKGHGKRIHQYLDDVDMTELNTSFDWGGGGLVSTNQDLSKFIKALFHNKLTRKRSLQKMMKVKFTRSGEDPYGLGLYASNYNGKTYFGHYGFYGSYLGYCPKDDSILSYNISQSNPPFRIKPLIERILKRMP